LHPNPLSFLEFLAKVAHRRHSSKRAAAGSIPAASTIRRETSASAGLARTKNKKALIDADMATLKALSKRRTEYAED
jgi:hypothetical protein